MSLRLMSSSDGESVFLTQNKFRKVDEQENNTDGILSDILDLKREHPKKQPNFDLKVDFFSDISDEELVKATQDIEGKENIERFARLNEEDLDNLIKKGLSKKTEQKSKWAMTLFTNWQNERKCMLPNHDTFMYQDIMIMSDEEINKTMSFFVAEVRNKSGEDYRPNSLYEIVCAIQHKLRHEGRFINFLDDDKFHDMRSILDSKMKELSGRGMGIKRKRAEIITEAQEDEMWSKGVLGRDTPQKLLDTLLFQLGLHFALRAGQEHRNLRVGTNSQISLSMDASGLRYLEYREDVSKTNRGGLQHKNLNLKLPEHTRTRMFPRDVLCSRLKLVKPMLSICDLCGTPQIPLGTPTPLLEYTLFNRPSQNCKIAGFTGHYTNHSLRATAATRLYDAGIDEQLITEKTGHRSTSVRSYKRTNEQQQ
ncbi:zinc finger MYM-type protein 2-like [Saccostrea cucullata]|uniref:zinc finger MYM-type protein 2-like n=1 Tax=Saccostrea cuccullata TaxID=36930 RepID=UPI002ECFAF57